MPKNLFHTFLFLLAVSIIHGSANHVFSQDSYFGSQFKRLEAPDGVTISIQSYGFIYKTIGSTDERMSMPAIYNRYLGVFADPDHENCFLALTQVGTRNNGMGFYRHDIESDTFEELIRTNERLRESSLTFQQLENGNVMLISNQGLLMHFRDGTHVDRFALDGYYQSPNKMFQPIQGVVSGNRAVFYSQLDPEFEGKALRDLVVFDEENGFRAIDLGDIVLGPGDLVGNQLKFMTNEGQLNFDIATLEIEKLAIKFPVVDGIELVPVQTFTNSKGESIGIFRKPHGAAGYQDIELFKDEFYTQIAELEEGEWKLKSVGFDTSTKKWFHRFAEDPQGRCWICGIDGRVVVRQENGEYVSLKQITELRRKNVAQISFDQGAIQFLSERNGTIHSSQMEKLLEQATESFPDWEKLRLRTILVADTQGTLYGISAKEGGKFVRIVDGKIEYLALPPRDQFRNSGFVYITTDMDNNVWLFADQQQRTAVFEEGEWTVFAPQELENGEALTSKQVAFQDRAQSIGDRTDYRIGFYGPLQVNFGRDQQVVFKNRKKRLAYFDGEQWHSPMSGYEYDRYYLTKPPFIYKNLICFENRGGAIMGMTKSAFQKMNQVADKRPWKKVNLSGKMVGELTQDQEFWRPVQPVRPGMENARKYRSGRNWFVVNDVELGIALHDQTWSYLPRRDTPLEQLRRPVLSGVQGNLFIFTDRYNPSGASEPSEHFAWQATSVNVQQPSKDLGEVNMPGQIVTPEIKTASEGSKIQIRYRVDDDPWSQWQAESDILVRGLIDPAEYELEVQVQFDEYLSLARTLKYQFTTTYSLREAIEAEINKLNSEQVSERESAIAKLLDIGPAAIPAIQFQIENVEDQLIDDYEKLIKSIRELHFGISESQSKR